MLVCIDHVRVLLRLMVGGGVFRKDNFSIIIFRGATALLVAALQEEGVPFGRVEFSGWIRKVLKQL